MLHGDVHYRGEKLSTPTKYGHGWRIEFENGAIYTIAAPRYSFTGMWFQFYDRDNDLMAVVSAVNVKQIMRVVMEDEHL